MGSNPIVDVHVHVLPGTDVGTPERDPYEIWEYGAKEDVAVSDLAGTIEQVTRSMERASCDHFVVVNMFVPDLELAKLVRQLPGHLAGASRERALVELGHQLAGRLKAFNTWALDLARSRHDMTAFVAMDPTVLGGAAGAEHLRWCYEQGALGVKLHPVLQRFMPDNPRMTAVFETCEELGLAVIAHAGASRGGVEFAEPAAFAPLLDRHPRLKLVLAHLGGARWRQTEQLAEAYPALRFDLCEIIAWTGAPGAPTRDELGRIIKAIGPHRILFGTDFPWYEVDETVDQLLSLPHLSDTERWEILGRNAIDFLGLPVAF